MAKQTRSPHERLKAWRESKGYHQKDAARLAGFSQGNWSFLERGERTPTLEQAFRLEGLTGGLVKAADWLPAKALAKTG